MLITTVTQKGQATIPVSVRNKFGLVAGAKVRFIDDNGELKLEPVADFFSFRGALKTDKKYNKKAVDKAIGKHLAQRYLKTLK